MIPTQNIEYEDTGCRYYPSCLECGEPDDCIFAKREVQTPDERKLRDRERSYAYYKKHRDEINEKKRLRRLEKARILNGEYVKADKQINELAKMLDACANGSRCNHCEYYSPCAEQCQAKMIEFAGNKCREIAISIIEQEKRNGKRF